MALLAICGYGLLMLACVALTATSFFTGNWSETKDVAPNWNRKIDHGIMPYNCINDDNNDFCTEWWKHLPNWQHAVLILMGIALIIELIALVWTVIAFFGCCYRRFIAHPLPLFSVLATIFIAAGLIVYGVNNKDVFRTMSIDQDGELGWSFWLGVAAGSVALLDVFVGVAAAHSGDRRY